MSDVERIAELRRMLADATHDTHDTSTADGTVSFIRSCARLGEAAISSLPWLLDAAEARIEAEHKAKRAESKAAQYEADWVAAKYEFGTATARLRDAKRQGDEDYARMMQERNALRELLSTLVYWHDQDGRVDESWWNAARDAIQGT